MVYRYKQSKYDKKLAPILLPYNSVEVHIVIAKFVITYSMVYVFDLNPKFSVI